MSLIELIGTILVFASTGLIGLVIVKRLAIPYSLLLVLLGFAISWGIAPFGWDTGVRASNFQDLMLFVLLPVLIFESALSLDSKLLFKFMPNIVTLATLGMVLSTLIFAVLLFYGIGDPGFPFIAALLTGAVISATDPVAVISQLRLLNAPKDLHILIEGESLFNDATAIVLFTILLGLSLGTDDIEVLDSLVKFVVVFVGGAMVGAILGVCAGYFLKVIEPCVQHIVLTTLVLAYGSFYLAEHTLHVSGIVAVLFAALAFKKCAATTLKQRESELHHIWQSLGFIANVFVFVLLGLVVSIEMFTDMWLAILIAIVAAFIARTAAVYISIWVNKVTLGEPTPTNFPPIMIWGGIRGAITIALVLSLPTTLPYWSTIQSIGFGVVLFSLIVQATTNPLLIKILILKQEKIHV